MTARLCRTHNKPFPCGKCRIENGQKPAQKPPSSVVTIIPPHRADAKPASRLAITPEIKKQIERSLASVPRVETSVVIEQVESSTGVETISTEENRMPGPDHVEEQADPTQKKTTRMSARPITSAKQSVYLKSVAHPVVASSDLNAPFGFDENGRPIRLGRTDQEIAAELRDKPYLAPGGCSHGNNPEYCLLCGTANYRAKYPTESHRELSLIEEALRLQGMRTQPAARDTFDYFPEILGITRRQLVGLLDLPVAVEHRNINRRVLKSPLSVDAKIKEIEKLVPNQIDRRKKLIAKSEECIRSFSKHIQKIQVKRGERNEEDILDKATRERFKREERQRVARCNEVIKQLRKRQANVDTLKQRLANWGSRPEDYEIVHETEKVIVTFRDKFDLSKRYREDRPDDSVENYFAMLTEYTLLKDESRRFRKFPAVDRWRYFENEIVFQGIPWGLVRPTNKTIKKYPVLDRSDTGRPQRDDSDLENQLIIKTGGAEIGASIYGAGTAWDGRKRGLSSFDNPVIHRTSESGSGATPGDFYGIDSGDFGAEE
jgi:hypothetical protein